VSGEARDKFEAEIEELKKTVEVLKNSIIDLRAAISELENPFNLLRALPVANSGDIPNKEEGKAQGQLNSCSRLDTSNLVEKCGARSEGVRAKEQYGEKWFSVKVSDFEEGFSVLRWVWTLMDAGMSKEDMINVTKYCERMGYLPLGTCDLVNYIADPLFKAKLGGLTLDEFLLIIYGAAKASGLKIRIEYLDELALSLLRKILKKIDNIIER